MNRKGQAILESLLVLLVLLAAFFFFFDFAYGFVAQQHLNNAAARAARADSVGFNSFQRAKAIRVAMLPVSGRRIVPDGGRTVATAEGELALVRSYLQSENDPEARGILHYERWDTLGHRMKRSNHTTESQLTFELPLSFPSQLGALFGHQVSDTGTRRLSATWAIEDHASYYLQDALND
ncbi:MAG: pilus assembly protein [Kiritimatiellae bacterium]|nr:pilus assembly protein [Kiritimatiellia bacterium]